MTKVTKTIGKLPVFKDAYVQGRVYSRLNQVTHLGSTFQSKIDNNTSVPGEVVNNELVVNASWTVISNGTAAYLAGNRLTTVENRTEQLEQDVNLLRGDVKGIVPNVNSVYNYFDIDYAKIKHIHFCVKYAYNEMQSGYPGSVIIGSNLGLSDGCIVLRSGGHNEAWLNTYGKKSLLVYNCMPNTLNTIDIVINDDDTYSSYVNGVKNDREYPLAARFKSVISSRLLRQSNGFTSASILYNLRFFNTKLTPQQIEIIYNQGRFCDVVFGDEWRTSYQAGVFNLNWDEWIATSDKDATAKSVTLLASVDNYTRINIGKYLVNKSGYYRVRFKIKDVTGGMVLTCIIGRAGYSDNILFQKGIYQGYTDTVEVYAYVKDYEYSSIFLQFVKNNVDKVCTVYDIEIAQVSLLNEYLPKNLTPTKWLDTLVTNQEISYTNPVLSLDDPYKDFQWGSSAPIMPPDAMGQIFYDVAARKKYECYGKNNTEQYGVGHWITK